MENKEASLVQQHLVHKKYPNLCLLSFSTQVVLTKILMKFQKFDNFISDSDHNFQIRKYERQDFIEHNLSFFIHARNNHMVIYEAQYKLDVTMANHDEVNCINYGLRCVGGSMAIHGYIFFEVEKELTMVLELLPNFNVRKSTYYDNNSLYVFLKYNAICIKT